MYKIASFFFVFLVTFSDSFPITTYTVTKSGRRVQLDGFLIEWKLDSAKSMGAASLWKWDALGTKEGLTGYFSGPCAAGADWTFSFLLHHLSPYSVLKLSFSPDAAQSFFRISQPGGGSDSITTAEWVIPWDSISLDSSGTYQVGIFGYNTHGDTLQPMILSGHVFQGKAASPWGKVYFKGVFLAVLVGVLFYVQKKNKNKFRRKKTPS